MAVVSLFVPWRGSQAKAMPYMNANKINYLRVPTGGFGGGGVAAASDFRM
jgi:hypothetical protein